MNSSQDPVYRVSMAAVARRFAAAVLALFSLLTAAPAAAAECKLQALNLPVQLVNQRPVVTVLLDGVEVPMLLDTGAFFSFLTEATAQQLKLKRRSLPSDVVVRGYTGQVQASLVTVRKMVIQGVPLANMDFLTGVNELGSGIGGVLGRNVLAMTDIEFDLAHGMVRLIFPKGDCDRTVRAYWAGSAPVIEAALDVMVGDPAPAIQVATRLNGTRMSAMLDSGAPYTSVAFYAARRAGVKEEDMMPMGTVGGVGAGRVLAWTAPVASFELAGQKIANNRFAIHAVDFEDHDLLIGLDYFLSHRIYVSWKLRKLWATWNGGPVFAARWDGSASDNAQAAAAQAIADDDADALARRGRASAARNDLAGALQDLTRACELAPRNAAHFVARAAVHLALKSPAQALADLDTALDLDASLHEARLQRARLRTASGEDVVALVDLAALDAVLPAASHLRAGMAELHAGQQRLPEALHQWEQWIATHRKDGGMADVLNARCWLRARMGVELDKALEDCSEAVRLAPAESSFHDSLGWTHLRRDEASRALTAFNEALELQPGSAWSLYGRGLVQLRLGRAEAAAKDLAAARRQRPTVDDEARKAGFVLPAGLPVG